MARSSRDLLKQASLAAVVGRRALLIACKRCFRKLVGAEHLLQVLSQKKTQWGSHCFSSFPPTVPSQTNTGLGRSFLPESSPCGVFKATAKRPSLVSASQQHQALHFLCSPSGCGSAREKGWHKDSNECHLFWRRGDHPHPCLSC